MAEHPTTLYHFTSHPRWHFIKREGINRGEAPISFDHVLNFPNLTSNPEPLAQKWACMEPDGERKTAARISVEIPAGDPLLISWRDFAKLHKMDRGYYRTLDAAGGWEARNWWIYQGAIRPEWFTDVEFTGDGRPNDHERLMLGVFEVSADFDEALKRMGATLHPVLKVMMIDHPATWDTRPTRLAISA